jgi:hypothetical protein
MDAFICGTLVHIQLCVHYDVLVHGLGFYDGNLYVVCVLLGELVELRLLCVPVGQQEPFCVLGMDELVRGVGLRRDYSGVQGVRIYGDDQGVRTYR